MAGPYYVRSTDGSDADSGLTWALAKATLAGALAVAAAGERIWVSQVHAETQATAMTLTSAGTAASPIEILCGNDGAEPPTALATTGTVTTTSTSNIAFVGCAYIYGLSFNCGTTGASSITFTSGAVWSFVFDTCALALLSANASSLMTCGVSAGGSPIAPSLTLLNTTIRLAGNATSQVGLGDCRFVMQGGSFITTSTPNGPFLCRSSAVSVARIIGVDLSLWGAGKSLVTVNTSSAAGSISFEQCKLGASVAISTGTNPGQGGPQIAMDNCDSADTQYRMQRYRYEGDVYSETTNIRTGGASDGTTALSHKYVSSANSRFTFPLYGPEMVIYAASPGSKTLTVEFAQDAAATALKDNEIWLEVEYLGTSGFPLSLFASDRMTNIVSTAADQDTSTASWAGLTTPTTQKFVVAVTTAEVGILRARVALAKATTTVYVDPLITVT